LTLQQKGRCEHKGSDCPVSCRVRPSNSLSENKEETRSWQEKKTNNPGLKMAVVETWQQGSFRT